ncbi:hypothetical protein B9G39_14960 [Zooshikella ganghwensis]|uniref:Uncharacterized protein n=1 Tax=Zooshikella ganghwensis TaxID=202772 RepID=A0A4P9VMJ8_9GAMM|nr:hypothetical protein B9G39_14960 [Zooshikella ganghwensis]
MISLFAFGAILISLLLAGIYPKWMTCLEKGLLGFQVLFSMTVVVEIIEQTTLVSLLQVMLFIWSIVLACISMLALFRTNHS